MSTTHERTRPQDYRVYALEQYILSEKGHEYTDDDYIRDLCTLTDFFSNEALPLVDNQQRTNILLRSKDVSQIKEKSAMSPIVEVSDIINDRDLDKGNNFMHKLILKPKSHEQSELSLDVMRAMLDGKIDSEDLPNSNIDFSETLPEGVDPEELEKWSKGKLEFKNFNNISHYKAFERMYALFPKFTTDLIVKVNSIPKSQWNIVEAHAYVAYNILSQLVDTEDDKDDSEGRIVTPYHLTGTSK
jgi:hypothetical protein